MGSVEVPSKHKALVYDNPGSISTKLTEVDTPKPGVGEILINLTHSGGTFMLVLTVTTGILTCLSMPLGESFSKDLHKETASLT